MRDSHQLELMSAENVMNDLSLARKIFHSEADFQHALAWELHRSLPSAKITLERPYRTGSAAVHLDMLVRGERNSLAIEVKYKTEKLECNDGGENFQLSHQSARDVGRYDFIKDICRLEKIVEVIPDCHGWAILLTNDSAYWGTSRKEGAVDAAFHLSDGGYLQGELSWGQSASAGTMKHREKPLVLREQYKLKWADYSSLSEQRSGRFRYLAVEVGR